MSNLEAAEKLREQGNGHYKSGSLLEAIECYRAALKVAPGDARPLSNLSAAYFELGKYGDAREHAMQALELLANDEQTKTVEARTEALSNRVEKCRQLLRREDASSMIKHKLTHVPRCRPSSALAGEYFSFGHDTVESLWDHHIDRYAAADEVVAFFFAGIGDARNLFGTILEIAQFEGQRPNAAKRRFHFTINDLKAAPIARDLIMLVLFQDLTELEDFSSNSATVLLSALFYVFHGPIMPKIVFAQVQLVISRLVKVLNEDIQPIDWVYIRSEDVEHIVRSLCSWQREVITRYSTPAMIERVVSYENERGYAMVPSYMKTEEVVYNLSGVLYPAAYILNEHERDLAKLIKDGEKSKPKSVGKKVVKLARERWAINPTMVDVDWQNSSKLELDVGHDPFGSIARFYEAGIIDKSRRVKTGNLYEILAPFFVETAKALQKLKGRVIVEAILGDFAQVLEQIQLNAIFLRGGNHVNQFPTEYDRIHMSNIPDYVGGFMTPFLYAFPLLKPQDSSWITANCLKNSGTWKSVEEYNAEYLLVPDLDRVEKIFRAKLLSRGAESVFPMTEYHRFGFVTSKPLSHSSLIDRDEYKKWMHSLFFKIVLPWHREVWNVRAVIIAPLNLSMFFRLISRLAKVGYPHHWLAESITSILSDTVTTSGRPPHKMPMLPMDVREEYPAKKLTTGPFVAELACLCALFKPLIPFEIGHPLIPPVNSLYEYYFDLRDSEMNVRPDIFNLVLMFWDHSMFINACDGGPPKDIRPLLDPSWSEVDSKMGRQSVEAFRERGVAVWSTFEWDGVHKVAKAIMDEEFVDMCKQQKWWMGLWRTDLWSRAFERPVEVRFALQKGDRWMDDE